MDALKAHDDAGSEDGGADVGADPVGVVLRRPAVDEEPSGDEEGAGDHERDAELWAAGIVVFLLQSPINAIINGSADLGSQEEP